VSATSMMF